MDSNWSSGRVTSAPRQEISATTGDVDRDGELVGSLKRQAQRAINLARTSIEETGTVSPAVWDLVDDSVGALLCVRIGTTIDPGPYRERPGVDQRIREAGADPAVVRRMLRVAS